MRTPSSRRSGSRSSTNWPTTSASTRSGWTSSATPDGHGPEHDRDRGRRRPVGAGRGTLPPPPGADNVGEGPAADTAARESRRSRQMPGSHAAEIVVDFLESSQDWPELVLVMAEDEAEPELDLPPLPPPRPPAAA